jgi:DNA-binding HxlR family transcriptional regulator
MRKKGYGQFCPVAKASELLAERWMPLVLREFLAGGRHYGELRRGIPLISPAMLSARLRELVEAGVVERRPMARGRWEYRLTEAGEELRPVIQAFGVWGQRWAQRELRSEQLDPELLVWVVRRRLNPKDFGVPRAVLELEFPEVPLRLRRFWFLVEPDEVDLCLKHPGRTVDVSVSSSVRTLTQVFLGQIPPEAAVRSGAIVLEGSRLLVRSFPRWCPRSPFASYARPASAAQKSWPKAT